MAYLENGAGRVEFRDLEADAAIEHQNSDRLAFNYSGIYDYIPLPFRIPPRVTLPVGRFNYDNAKVSSMLGQPHGEQGPASGARHAYDGHRRRSPSAADGSGRCAVGGTDVLGQPRRAPGRVVQHQPGRVAHHVHADGAEFRDALRSITRPRTRWRRTFACGGSGRAASCSSSTTSSATRWRARFGPDQSRASSSR